MNIFLRIMALVCISVASMQAFDENATDPWAPSKRDEKLAGKRHKLYLEKTTDPRMDPHELRLYYNARYKTSGYKTSIKPRHDEPYYYRAPDVKTARAARAPYVQQLEGKIRVLESGSILGRMRNWVARHMGSKFERKLWARR